MSEREQRGQLRKEWEEYLREEWRRRLEKGGKGNK